MLSRRTMFAAPLALLAPRVGSAQAVKMSLSLHSNTSAGAGYRRALEEWARAGIRNVELNAAFVDEFLKADTLEGARRVF